METFDVIVLGVGAMGSAALYHLSKRGLKACPSLLILRATVDDCAAQEQS